MFQVRDFWKKFEAFIEKQEDERQIVESVIEGSLEKYKIDSNELNVKVPDLLLRECEKEIQRVNCLPS